MSNEKRASQPPSLHSWHHLDLGDAQMQEQTDAEVWEEVDVSDLVPDLPIQES